LEDALGLSIADLEALDWDALSEIILGAIQKGFARRRERLLGAKNDGLIARDIEKYTDRLNGSPNENQLLSLLIMMPQGARATFDRKTHRRIWERTTRLNYIYYAAHFVEQQDTEQLTEEVLAHLQEAQKAIQRAWGRSEYQRLAAVPPAELDEKTQRGLRNVLGEAAWSKITVGPLAQASNELQLDIIDELGRQAITEVYRQLLLGVISELWVDYLTQMEALRVSIGLEAYAQRDPLVQYKSRAFAMFQTLLSNMRVGVVNRMFTFRPRDVSSVQTEVKRVEGVQQAVVEAPTDAAEPPKKRKRRRRRRK
jgi:preprotein translocase subunit SecA